MGEIASELAITRRPDNVTISLEGSDSAGPSAGPEPDMQALSEDICNSDDDSDDASRQRCRAVSACACGCVCDEKKCAMHSSCHIGDLFEVWS